MKNMILVLLCMLLLCGCSGKQETSENTTAPAETSAGSLPSDEVQETTPKQTNELSMETVPVSDEEETIPKEWISYEETPETPTRPVQVAEEQSIQDMTMPTESIIFSDSTIEEALVFENETPIQTG